jgi:LmbE family N-acetylglucosaminyl deacetylase
VSNSKTPSSPPIDTNEIPDGWKSPQKILVVLAHPDDPEFFCGATIAKWVSLGHHVTYCLITSGDKGTKDRNMTSEALSEIRQKEQQAAARILGVNDVRFLNYQDGYLIPDLKLRRDITRVIRQEKPDIVVTCDPTTLFFDDKRINHPDHRAAGQATLDAIFPAARDHLFFIELWQDEKLEPHNVREVWVSGSLQPNTIIDVTAFWDIKLKALHEHKTQIGDAEEFNKRMRSRIAKGSTLEAPRYEEKYRKIVLG